VRSAQGVLKALPEIHVHQRRLEDGEG